MSAHLLYIYIHAPAEAGASPAGPNKADITTPAIAITAPTPTTSQRIFIAAHASAFVKASFAHLSKSSSNFDII